MTIIIIKVSRTAILALISIIIIKSFHTTISELMAIIIIKVCRTTISALISIFIIKNLALPFQHLYVQRLKRILLFWFTKNTITIINEFHISFVSSM